MMTKLPIRALALSLAALAVSCAPTQREQPVAPTRADLPVVGGATMYPNYTIAQNLRSSGDHKMLAAAIDATSAAQTLSGTHGYTLFAPTDMAFRTTLPNGTVEALMHPRSQQELNRLVTYHVVPGAKNRSAIMADVQAGGGSAAYRTAAGATLRVTMEAGRIVLTDGNGRRSTVSQADITSSNGVFHVVDGVLLPPL